MRHSLQIAPGTAWLLLAAALAGCLTLGGCSRFSPPEKLSNIRSARTFKRADWFDGFRDDRALEVERHMDGSEPIN